jgi:hypothetical protein
VAFGQVLGDGKRLPDHDVAVVEARHEAGENGRYAGFGPPVASCTRISSNGAPESLAHSHPRSDHDE